MPAQAGIQSLFCFLGSRLRGNDEVYFPFLIAANVGVLDDLRPLLALALDVSGEHLRGSARGFGAVGGEACDDVRISKRLVGVAVQTFDDRARRPRRGEQGVPL